MNIRKVKQRDGKTIVLAEEVDGDGEPVKKIEVVSKQEPSPAFVEAFAALLSPAMSLIGAPVEWRERARVAGCSINHEGDRRRGVVVTLLIDLPSTNAPLVLNTPHMRESTSIEDQGDCWMPGDLLVAMEAVIKQAGRFLDGERAQADLFKEAA